MFIMLEFGKIGWDIYFHKNIWGIAIYFIAIRIIFTGFDTLIGLANKMNTVISEETYKELNASLGCKDLFAKKRRLKMAQREISVKNSSQIEKMWYNNGELTVKFKKSTYKYQNVGEDVFETFVKLNETGDKIGKAFAHIIRKHPEIYPYTKVGL